MNKVSVLLILVLSFLGTTNAYAVYKCTDEKGRKTFQDRPCPNNVKAALYSKETDSGKLKKSITKEKLTDFFNEYVRLSDNFDPAIAELYSDNAKISTLKKFANGSKQNMELSGEQWKALIGRLMPFAKKKNDKSEYSNITINHYNKNYVIKANRYSLAKCYHDYGYYMVIESDRSGDLLIIEEYMEEQELSDC